MILLLRLDATNDVRKMLSLNKANNYDFNSLTYGKYIKWKQDQTSSEYHTNIMIKA